MRMMPHPPGPRSWPNPCSGLKRPLAALTVTAMPRRARLPRLRRQPCQLPLSGASSILTLILRRVFRWTRQRRLPLHPSQGETLSHLKCSQLTRQSGPSPQLRPHLSSIPTLVRMPHCPNPTAEQLQILHPRPRQLAYPQPHLHPHPQPHRQPRSNPHLCPCPRLHPRPCSHLRQIPSHQSHQWQLQLLPPLAIVVSNCFTVTRS
mmetsp:Transcript_87798/g.152753  ORF Transcript_87798/g.152753 Transcript_87798/m.152753 type:complete len:205 (-) Transcript_87798:826-1440(-)